MNKLFAAFFLIFLDFNLTLNNCVLGLLPDFIGYILMAKGLDELAEESPRFPVLRPWATGMAVYTGVLYAIDLLGIAVEMSWRSILLGVASLAVSLYISNSIIAGIKDIETALHTDFQTERLQRAWLVMAVASVAAYALIAFGVLAILAIIAGSVASIVFLVCFYRVKEHYYADSAML